MAAEPHEYRLVLGDRAVRLGYRLGSDTLLILLDLAAHATSSPEEGIVVSGSYRDISRRLGISKDTVGRRLALLRRDGVIVERREQSPDRFETRSYRLYLDFAGMSREPSRVAL